jgi:hypothetical protein
VGGSQIRGQLPPDASVQVGDQVRIAVSPSDIHFVPHAEQ